jgi:hypothetical protein
MASAPGRAPLAACGEPRLALRIVGQMVGCVAFAEVFFITVFVISFWFYWCRNGDSITAIYPAALAARPAREKDELADWE